jgi:radical SAM/Cys-rich protein
MQSLKARKSDLSKSENQLEQLNHFSPRIEALARFENKLAETGLFPLKPTQLEIFQVNLGKLCNQTCAHCHVDAGPDRREIMTLDMMKSVLLALKNSMAHTVDMTGGAPEMIPHFRWFVEQITNMNKKVIVRCNLTIILANKSFHDLPEFYKKHKIHIVSSLPYYEADKTDRQRGKGVFELSIEALRMLNAVGYGREGSGLELDLVYNPSGAFLPGSQAALQSDFKAQLLKKYNIEFNQLFAITNMPISRFLDYLIASENFEDYMEKLLSAYNSGAATGVMCRNTISVGWDGYLYDCDFNQMLELKVATKTRAHIDDYNEKEFSTRSIVSNQHCFGCTAGAGSSCGGSTI